MAACGDYGELEKEPPMTINWQDNMDFEPSEESVKIAGLHNVATYKTIARLIDHLNGTVPEDADLVAARELYAAASLYAAAGLRNFSSFLAKYKEIKHGRASK